MIDGSGQALLCDFGMSRIRHEVTRTHTCIRGGGRELFIPPELLEQDEPRPIEAGDIYSLAMSMLKLGTGEDPFEGEYDSKYEAKSAAQLGHRPRKPPTLGGLPAAQFDALWSLLESMWAHDPAQRPSASEVIGVTRQLIITVSHTESVAES